MLLGKTSYMNEQLRVKIIQNAHIVETFLKMNLLNTSIPQDVSGIP